MAAERPVEGRAYVVGSAVEGVHASVGRNGVFTGFVEGRVKNRRVDRGSAVVMGPSVRHVGTVVGAARVGEGCVHRRVLAGVRPMTARPAGAARSTVPARRVAGSSHVGRSVGTHQG